jgi:hypothetical protein
MGWLQQVLEGPEVSDFSSIKAEGPSAGGGGVPPGASRV